jgi:hypothetical protein
MGNRPQETGKAEERGNYFNFVRVTIDVYYENK